MVSVAGLLVDAAAAGGSNMLECIEQFLIVVFLFLGLVSVAVFFIWFPSWQENVCLWFPPLFCLMVSHVARNVFVWFPSFFLMVSGCYKTAAVSPMETVKKHQDVSVN